MNQKVYKIRNADGLFSTGGSSPRWDKKGKTWSGLGPLKLHLDMFQEPSRQAFYKGAIVCCYELRLVELERLSAEDVLKEQNARRKKREDEYKARYRAEQEAAERKRLEELKAKYD